jgi:hypothetical protein
VMSILRGACGSRALGKFNVRRHPSSQTSASLSSEVYASAKEEDVEEAEDGALSGDSMPIHCGGLAINLLQCV